MIKILTKSSWEMFDSGKGNYVNEDSVLGKAFPHHIQLYCAKGLRPDCIDTIHNRWLLNVNLGCECILELDNLSIRLKKGACILVHPYQIHLFKQTNVGVFRLQLAFDMTVKEPPLPPGESIPMDKKLFELLCMIVNYARDTASVRDMELLLSLILSRMQQLNAQSVIPNPERIVGNISLAAEVYRYVSENLEKDLRLESLAKKFGCSASKLRRIFFDQSGLGIGKYITRIRMLKAVFYLSKDDKNISEIADLCGYSCIQTFSRAFHAWQKMSPNQFRKESRYLKSMKKRR